MKTKPLTIILTIVLIITFFGRTYSQGAAYYLNCRSNRYDAEYSKLKAAYDDLMNCELLNKYNKETLNKYKTAVKEWTDKNFSSIDLSLPQNSDGIAKFYNEWYSVKSIQQEISLIKNVKAEITRLKYKDPDNFYKSDRYKEMGLIFKELENCKVEEISNIAWQHGLSY